MTLSNGPSEPTRIYFFLSSFFNFWASAVLGFLEFFSIISIPKNNPAPLTSPIQLNSFYNILSCFK